jgi:hypothetical protein
MTNPLPGQVLHEPQPPVLQINDDDEYEIDEVVAQKPTRGGKQQYLVK